MTTTALRALLASVGALCALATASPAYADTGPACSPDAPVSTPECPNPWPDDTNVTVCMTDPALCEPEAEVIEVPAAAPAPQADPGSAPADAHVAEDQRPTDQRGDAPVTVDTAATAQPAAQAGVPLWVLQDKSNEAVRDIMARCAYAFAVLG